MCLLTDISCIPLEHKVFENRLYVKFVGKKLILQNNTPAIRWLKCCCLLGKLGKHIKFGTFLFTR